MASRPTKYAHVVAGLPKYLGEDEDRLTLLNKLREEILATPVDEEADYNISAQHAGALRGINSQVEIMLNYAKRCPLKSASGLARAYADARLVLDGISEWRSSAQLLVDALERMMVDQMEVEDVRSLRLSSGASVSTSQEPYGKVVDKEAFRLWCVAPADRCMTCGGDPADDRHSPSTPHTCEEMKVGNYQALDLGMHKCGQGAYTLVQPRGRDESPYWLCKEDAFHYLSNRDCVDVTPEGSPKPSHDFKPGGGFEKQLQLWPSSMNALAKERTLAGVAPPDGVEVTVKTLVRLNKA